MKNFLTIYVCKTRKYVHSLRCVSWPCHFFLLLLQGLCRRFSQYRLCDGGILHNLCCLIFTLDILENVGTKSQAHSFASMTANWFLCGSICERTHWSYILFCYEITFRSLSIIKGVFSNSRQHYQMLNDIVNISQKSQCLVELRNKKCLLYNKELSFKYESNTWVC